MTISYNWLCDYLPIQPDPEKLSRILTSIGLEVESLETYDSIRGGLKGLVTGEVLTCEKHPDADKLKLTTVDIGQAEPLQIVCGAPNVGAGQKVVVAPVGTTVHPNEGDPFLIKKAKIRGVESAGMICAEDEIGLGISHDGILVLPPETAIGMAVTELFPVYTDFIYEIGLTPNRMDAMSHLGVARDVCAWISHHEKNLTQVKSPFVNGFQTEENPDAIQVELENPHACKRYAAIQLSGIKVQESPEWLQNKLKSIGVKPINNIVDITNFILHETGQPLHAFDAEKISGQKIIVKTLPANTVFTTLDEKERKLSENDLMICDTEGPLCMAGVYGGLHSGITSSSTELFLESAWFDPVYIRKTSLLHGLRTDAAIRFEKSVDISQTVTVLKRAALLIKELAGGSISSAITDIYPEPVQQKSVGIKYHYLKKLSGKNYHGDSAKKILEYLGFNIIKDTMDELWVNVPYSKPDISHAADIVEEIMRIDGLDNIPIPSSITMSPGEPQANNHRAITEKTIHYLTGAGFHEIFTNSITNSKYYSAETLQHTVKMINNLSADLDILRPSMLETGLEVLLHNINRKQTDLSLFEYGKIYSTEEVGNYREQKMLALFITGNVRKADWKHKAQPADFYYLKGICQNIFTQLGLTNVQFEPAEKKNAATLKIKNQTVGSLQMVADDTLKKFDIKQPVVYAELCWETLGEWASDKKLKYKEVARFPVVERDLALIVNKDLAYSRIEKVVQQCKLNPLKSMKLFDVFESEKLGAGKKSMAVNFSFADENKTLTDAEIDEMMKKLVKGFETDLEAVIRK